MKKIIIFAVFILTMYVFASAQSPRAVLDKVKEIKLLESNRKDVEKILKDFELDETDEEDFTQEFSNDDVDIEITYSNGNCFAVEEDDDQITNWKTAEWKVVRIEISFNESIKIEDIENDLSEFKKEQRYANVENSYIYHNKDLGIAFEVDEEDSEEEGGEDEKTVEDKATSEEKILVTDTIFLFPSSNNSLMLCDNNETAKTFYSSESWFGDSKLEDRVVHHESPPANVEELILSATEITAIPGNAMKILVTTVARDPDNDVLTYNYTISGGKIDGQGVEVVWDLSGVAPGTYTITAGVDDGCGICGATKTKTVVVKKAPDRTPK